MNSFSDLEKSTDFNDNMIFIYLTKLITQIFGKLNDIVIDQLCETDQNQKLIIDQWKLIDFYFKVPKRVLNTQKIVRQTIKYIVDYLNETYQFKQPVKWDVINKAVREGKNVISQSYTTLAFV